MVTAALIILGVIAVSALAGVGWMARWTITTQAQTARMFAEMMAETTLAQSNATTTLVLGYRDFLPTNDPSSTAPSETEKPGPDVHNLADMPDHIRDQMEREATEDAEMERFLSRPFSTAPSDSPT
jgi:hypothetical protein